MPSTVSQKGHRLDVATEDFLARLTDAAYRVALKHGISGSFLDMQLDLWAALRGEVAKQPAGRSPSRRAVAVS